MVEKKYRYKVYDVNGKYWKTLKLTESEARRFFTNKDKKRGLRLVKVVKKKRNTRKKFFF